jgi:hypothetical protein
MKKLIFIPLLFLFVFCEAQFSGRGSSLLRTGTSFMSASVVVEEGGGDYPSALDNADTTKIWIDEDSAEREADDSVSLWIDKTTNGYDLNITDLSPHKAFWTSTGIRFGINSSLEVNINLTQPYTVYVVATMNSWVANRMFMFFDPDGSPMIKQDGWDENPGGYGLSLYAGSYITKYGMTLGTHIFKFVFNGANSSLNWDEGEAVTGNAGTNTNATFEFGYSGNTANFTVREAIVRSKVDATSVSNAIIDYLNTKYSVY